MPIKKLRPEFTFTEDRLRELLAVVPEAFADGKVNWETLREALGIYLEDDEQGAEHFGLSWPGKGEARRLAAKPSKGALIPAPGEGINEDTAHNLFIEGDNLEVLKLIQKSYAGLVKMIYIDPPYNTGHDFIYRDDFRDPLDDYFRKTAQANEEGERVTSNPKAGGRFHSNWLNMLYPRLLLSRRLLREDGAIAVSIDDNEFHNLRQLMDEVFGLENFQGTIVWQHSVQGKNDAKDVSVHHNYILLYRKSEAFSLRKVERTEEHNKAYSNPDNDPKGQWRSGDVRSPRYRENLKYVLVTPSGKKIQPPPNGWRWDRQSMQEKIRSEEVIFLDNETRILRKIYLANQEGRVTESIWFGKDTGTTRDAASELKELFGGQAPFDTPKPTKLVETLMQVLGVEASDIVVDFFAGSCSTAHAVIQANHSKGLGIRFLMVQIPETAGDSAFSTIAEIGKERIRRVIKKTKAESKGKLKLNQSEKHLAFKVFKLGRSNYRAWQDYSGDYVEELETLFTQAETPLVEGWTPESLLTETMLLEGFPLDSTVTEAEQFKHNKVWRVESDACANRLWVCLDKRLKDKTLEALVLPDEDIFICLDNALTDENKLRLADQINLHVI